MVASFRLVISGNNGCYVSGMVKRKTLVLDLDETLIHSHHEGVLRQTVKPATPPDFVLKVHVLPALYWINLCTSQYLNF